MKLDEKKRERILHPIPPLYDKDSKILILGSFPSVKSREQAFFYGHPQNRFWKMLAGVLSEKPPVTVEEKRIFLHKNHVALWDVIQSCDIIGSSDSSIRNVVPNDLSEIFEAAEIRQIYCNGAKSYEYYRKYLEEKTGRKAVKLPSTSPANAAFSLEKLIENWKTVCVPLKAASPEIGRVLLGWYDYNARILPWRSDPTPYHVWVSEIMLQQTRVEVVKKYYDRWMERLPDVAALAAVSDEELIKLWEGLGYYNRARNLKEAAIAVMEQFDGRIPADYEKLLSLKGVGEYTAGAIASIAFGLPEPAVDGNVLRIFSRLLALAGEINRSPVKKKITAEVRRVMPENRSGDFNQALMDLGATICIPNGEPFCDRCPWEASCQAHKLGKEMAFPVRAAKKQRKKEEKSVFLIEVSGKVAIHKREQVGLLGGLWELPNVDGKVTEEDVEREIKKWEKLLPVGEREENGEEFLPVGEREENEEKFLPVGEREEKEEILSESEKEKNLLKLEGQRGFSPGDYIIESLGEGKHIFSHVEWQMKGYRLRLKEISERLLQEKQWILVTPQELKEKYAIPSAFDCYKKQIDDGETR